jgi:hypothetical protein
MRASERIWWIKIAAAVGVAFLSLILQAHVFKDGLTTFMLGTLIYMGLSDLLARMSGVDRSRGLKIGVGAYFFTWIVTWVALYTILLTYDIIQTVA